MNLVVTSTDLRMRVGHASGWSVIVDRIYYHGEEAVASKPIWKKSFPDFASAHAACMAMAHGAALMALELSPPAMDQPLLPEGVVPEASLVSLN